MRVWEQINKIEKKSRKMYTMETMFNLIFSNAIKTWYIHSSSTSLSVKTKALGIITLKVPFPNEKKEKATTIDETFF